MQTKRVPLLLVVCGLASACGGDPFARAVMRHDDGTAQQLIAQGLDVHADYAVERWSPRRPLLLAIQNDASLATVKALLDKGADPNEISASYSTMTPLAAAVCSLVGSDRPDLVALLLERGANPLVGYQDPSSNADGPLSCCGNRPKSAQLLIARGGLVATPRGQAYSLVFAKQADIIRIIADRGYGLNAVDGSGTSGLHAAVEACNSDAVEAFLEKGANPRIRNKDGKTPADLVRNRPTWCRTAATWKRSNVEMLAMLDRVAAGAKDMVGSNDRNEFLKFRSPEQTEIDLELHPEWLTARGDSSTLDAYEIAVNKEAWASADVMERRIGTTHAMRLAVHAGKVQAMLRLLDRGYNPASPEPDHSCLLYEVESAAAKWPREKDQDRFAQLLLSKLPAGSARPDGGPKTDWSAVAVTAARLGDVDTLLVIAQKHPKILSERVDHYGCPIEIAGAQGHCAAAARLVQAGIAPTPDLLCTLAESGATPAEMEVLIKAGAPIDSPARTPATTAYPTRTPLVVAALHGNRAAVTYLLAHGARDPGNSAAVTALIAYGDPDDASALAKRQLLYEAIERSDLDTIKALAAGGLDLKRRAPDGTNAYGTARHYSAHPFSRGTQVLVFLDELGLRPIQLPVPARARDAAATEALRKVCEQHNEEVRHGSALAIVATLRAGADPDVLIGGMPLLHWAVLRKEFNVAAAILEAGSASANTVAADGKPLLATAQDATLVGALIAGGADPTVLNPNGRPVLWEALAKADWNTALLLVRARASVAAAALGPGMDPAEQGLPIGPSALRHLAQNEWSPTAPIPAELVALAKGQGVALKKLPALDFGQSGAWCLFPLKTGARWTYIYRSPYVGPTPIMREVYVWSAEPKITKSGSRYFRTLEVDDGRGGDAYLDDRAYFVDSKRIFTETTGYVKHTEAFLGDPELGGWSGSDGVTDWSSHEIKDVERTGKNILDTWKVVEKFAKLTIPATKWSTPRRYLKDGDPNLPLNQPRSGTSPERTFTIAYKLKHWPQGRDFPNENNFSEISYYVPMIGLVRHERYEQGKLTEVYELVDWVAEAP